jgi:hypothetical protein
MSPKNVETVHSVYAAGREGSPARGYSWFNDPGQAVDAVGLPE